MKTTYIYDKHLAELFVDREMFQTKVLEKAKPQILSETFLSLGITQRDVYHNV